MRRFRYILLIICLLGVCTTAATAQNEIRSIDGVVINMGADWEQDQIETAEEIFPSLEIPQSASLHYTGDGESYVLFSGESLRTGEITGEAEVLIEATADNPGILIGEDVTVSSDGLDISAAEYAENSGAYNYELVDVSGRARSVTYTLDGEQVVRQQMRVSIADEQPALFERALPGRTARTIVMNLSSNELGGDRTASIAEQTLQPGVRTTGVAEDGTRWVVDSNATVTAVATPAGLVVREIEPDATRVDNLDELSQHHGEVVTVETAAAGSRISAQETLLTAKRCAPSSITNPVTGCFPIPVDSVVHAGLLFDASDPSSTAIYSGSTNTVQSEPVVPESGRYEVTGRVVSASAVDPRLNGSALVVYNRERVGDIQVGDQIEELRLTVADRVREQITANESEWQAVQSRNQDESQTGTTPTSTATQTRAGNATRSGAATTTSTTEAHTPTEEEYTMVVDTPRTTTGNSIIGINLSIWEIANLGYFGVVIAGPVCLLSGIVMSTVASIQRFRGQYVSFDRRENAFVWIAGTVLTPIGIAGFDLQLAVFLLGGIAFVAGWSLVLRKLVSD